MRRGHLCGGSQGSERYSDLPEATQLEGWVEPAPAQELAVSNYSLLGLGLALASLFKCNGTFQT